MTAFRIGDSSFKITSIVNGGQVIPSRPVKY